MQNVRAQNFMKNDIIHRYFFKKSHIKFETHRSLLVIFLLVFKSSLFSSYIHPEIFDIDVTLIFLNFIFKFWKIVNFHSPCNGLRFQDPLRSATRSVECGNLKQLVEFAGIAQRMHPNTVKRVNSLTKDNSRGLSHTCRGLFDLAKYLI